ncbi:MAG: 2-phospho-L-lactate guanylyltransferase [Chloroflexi bacterium]|nr:MAG: 2-phospho-L-lactate guanylyltransferase [Chloroflexota bacterium]
MTSRVIVPHRGLAVSKSRLSPVLSPDERGELAAHLLRRVLRIARQAVPDVVVISPSADLADLVEATGARLLVQRGMGLNEGLDQARDAAIGDGVETLVVLHGDLPELDVPDIQALVGALPRDGGVAIAPDRRGTGTNALVLRPPNAIPFRFGTDSLAAHRDAAKSGGTPLAIVRRPGLAFDLDTPDDLGEWLRSGVLA